jgi:fatty-acyl-CoA synthase
MQLGAMQDWKLRVTHLLDHAAREHGARELVSHWADGTESRTTWAGIRRDALKMTQALQRIGIQPGDRIATLAMNHHRHLVTWYGAVGAGGILHTINPRLFDDQLEYIVAHAEDRVLLFDKAFAPIVERMKPRWPTIERYVCFDPTSRRSISRTGSAPRTAMPPGRTATRTIRACCATPAAPPAIPRACSRTVRRCCTRSPAPAGGVRHGRRTVMMPIVPMFHAASWGLPWAGRRPGPSSSIRR